MHVKPVSGGMFGLRIEVIDCTVKLPPHCFRLRPDYTCGSNWTCYLGKVEASVLGRERVCVRLSVCPFIKSPHIFQRWDVFSWWAGKAVSCRKVSAQWKRETLEDGCLKADHLWDRDPLVAFAFSMCELWMSCHYTRADSGPARGAILPG